MLVATVNHHNIKEASKYASGLILTNRLSNYSDSLFSFEEIKSILKDYPNHEIFIFIDALYFDSDLKEIKEFILAFKDTKLKYIFGDLAIYQFLKEFGILNKGIYYPYTMIANYADLNCFKGQLYGVCPTNEIPLKDVDFIAENKGDLKIFFKAFGYSLMYQSKRMILSTYQKAKKKDFVLNNDLYLVEETRDDKYKVLENHHGSFIFQSGIFNILEALDKVKNVDYIILDSRFIADDKFIEALKIYHDASNDLDNLKSYNQKLKDIFDNLNNDFIYEDSIFRKEDF